MKHIIVGSIFFLLAISACNTNKEVALNRTVPKEINIDGQTTEWQQPLDKPVAHMDIQCAIANDENTLYVCARIADKAVQRRIMSLGMTIWIDTLMKNREKVGVGYPIALSEADMQRIAVEAQDGDQLDPRALDNAYAKTLDEFELIGLAEETVRVSNLASLDMKVATAFDHVGAMVCELKIPLYHLWKQKIDFNENFSVGIKVNPPPKDAAEEPGLFDDPSQNGITRSSQQNPMMGGNGLPGQQPNQSRQRMRMTSESTGVWYRTTLVNPIPAK
jgi:hypothetical protein